MKTLMMLCLVVCSAACVSGARTLPDVSDNDAGADADSDIDSDSDTDAVGDADGDSDEVPVVPSAECDERSDCDDGLACTVDTCAVSGRCEYLPDSNRCPAGYACDTDVGCVAIPPDRDGDGWVQGEDCDDNNPDVFPGALEECNGRDDDCDGMSDEDANCPPPDNDGDGVPVGEDCDDNNAAINPGAAELCNGRDDDCDGLSDERVCGDEDDGDADSDADADVDSDGDGCFVPDDCDDNNPDVFPGAAELCNGRDDDCDGVADEDCPPPDGNGNEPPPDGDGDGIPDVEDDCPRDVNPGQSDMDGDGFGDTCDCDADGDDCAAISCGGGDCNDLNSQVVPGAADPPNDGWDWDCDGLDA